MKESLEHYLGGYLLVRLNGFSPERFFNLCAANQIGLWGLCCEEGAYRFYITVRDFRRVRPLARKAQVRLRIAGRAGLPFFLYRNRRRKLFGVGIGLFFLVLAVMSRFIWNISIEGNRRFTDDTLLHYLDTLDIRYGRPRAGIDCDSLEEAIRGHYPDIIWVSARISGTRLLIKIKENEVMGKIPVKDESPRDLVAEKAGTISRMIVRSGKAQVSPGDAVEPGQLLVSGIVPILNDAEELVNERLVRADGDIYALVEESYREMVPRFTTGRTDTGRTRRGLRLRLGGLSFLWLLPPFGEDPWEITIVSRQVTVLGDFYLPVWVDEIEAREYQTCERLLTKEELDGIQQAVHRRKQENLQEKDVQILENSVRIINKGTDWEIQGRFLAEEKIGAGRALRQTAPESENGGAADAGKEADSGSSG